VGELGWRREGKEAASEERRNRGDHGHHHSPVLWRYRAASFPMRANAREYTGLCNLARIRNLFLLALTLQINPRHQYVL
jgi:hypothetical protein